jgi:hypothetical protein
MKGLYKQMQSPVGKLTLVTSAGRLMAISWEDQPPKPAGIEELEPDSRDPVLVEAAGNSRSISRASGGGSICLSRRRSPAQPFKTASGGPCAPSHTGRPPVTARSPAASAHRPPAAPWERPAGGTPCPSSSPVTGSSDSRGPGRDSSVASHRNVPSWTWTSRPLTGHGLGDDPPVTVNPGIGR